MDKFLKYMKEREGLKSITNEHGFLLYKFLYEGGIPKACLINDYYVIPEKRRNGLGFKLADQILEYCKARKIKRVFCQSDLRAHNHRGSMLSILNYGFDVYKTEGPIIHYFLEVDKWEKR
jgi:GNAT superfamily N-acetyltransferase